MAELYSSVSRRKFEREKQARELAEKLLEEKSLELYDLNLTLEGKKQSLEKALSASEMANSRLSDYVAMTSHELRTPLTSIIGMANLLMIEPPRDEKSSKIINVIVNAASILLNKLNLFLDLARLDQGEYSIQEKQFQISTLLMQLEQRWTERLMADKLQFQLTNKLDIDQGIIADPTAIACILDGLISNAKKFTRQGKIEIQITVEGEQLCFRCHDTGIGIAESEQERIFERFFRADSSETRSVAGAGIGLSITKKLAQLQGGDVVLERSRPGHGSVFLLTLPLKSCTAPPLKTQIHSKTGLDLKGLNILVVEDEPSIQMVMELILESLGIKVTMAENGEQAVKLAAKNTSKFDAILMDLEMPVMGGIEATRAIRALGQHCATIPILAFTANALVGTQNRCLDAGMTAYLAKPANAEMLKNAILEAMQKN